METARAETTATQPAPRNPETGGQEKWEQGDDPGKGERKTATEAVVTAPHSNLERKGWASKRAFLVALWAA